MKNITKIALLALTASMVGCNKTHIVVTMGQSNMVGTNQAGEYANEVVDSRIKVLGLDNEIRQATQNNLYAAKSEYTSKYIFINSAGVGPSVSFAKEYIASIPKTEDVVVVPCARGMSLMNEQVLANQKNVYGIQYEKSLLEICMERVEIAKKKLPFSSVDAVLYYQGESDAIIYDYFNKDSSVLQNWESGLLKIKNDFLEKFGTKKFVFAQIGQQTNITEKRRDAVESFKNFQAEVSYRNNIPMITTDDLTLDDNIHLDAYSQQIVGQRFFEKFSDQ